VLSRNPVNKKYPNIQKKHKTVKEFYYAYQDEVEIVELSEYVG